MRFDDAVKMIEEIAPLDNTASWDNSGVQIKTGDGEIRRIIVCLEINADVLEEAKSEKADMILTHHPLIFNSLKTISDDDYPGAYVQEAIKNGISVYSAHLTFDFAPEGNNVYMAGLLGISLEKEGSLEHGYYGRLPKPMTMEEACRHVEKALDLPLHYIRCVDGGKKLLFNVGLCTGAGGDYIFEAASGGCDLFITGDLKLHEAQYARAKGMSVIDAGHYGTEKIFTTNMACLLAEKAAEGGYDVEIIKSEANTNPYTL